MKYKTFQIMLALLGFLLIQSSSALAADELTACSQDADCPFERPQRIGDPIQRCVLGYCGQAQCFKHDDCGAKEACSGHQCYQVECKTHSQCNRAKQEYCSIHHSDTDGGLNTCFTGKSTVSVSVSGNVLNSGSRDIRPLASVEVVLSNKYQTIKKLTDGNGRATFNKVVNVPSNIKASRSGMRDQIICDSGQSNRNISYNGIRISFPIRLTCRTAPTLNLPKDPTKILK